MQQDPETRITQEEMLTFEDGDEELACGVENPLVCESCQ